MIFELYRKRDFSANFSDTTKFFKTFGKHFFKNYFIINGIFLMILVVLVYFFSKIYMEFFMSKINNVANSPNDMLAYFYDNMFLFGAGFLVTFILIAILSMLNITYPIVYLQLLEKYNDTNFSTQEIVSGLKENIGKMIGYFFGNIFVIFPIAAIIFIPIILLCLILIGIPLLFIVGSAFLSWITLSYYEHILNNVGFFKSLKNGFAMVKSQFWKVVGITFVMLLVIQTLQLFITLIPYIIGLIFLFTSSQDLTQTNSQTETFSTLGIMMAVILVLSILLSYICNNFILISQGLIYYSSKEDTENIGCNSQIDLIGTDVE